MWSPTARVGGVFGFVGCCLGDWPCEWGHMGTPTDALQKAEHTNESLGSSRRLSASVLSIQGLEDTTMPQSQSAPLVQVLWVMAAQVLWAQASLAHLAQY